MISDADIVRAATSLGVIGGNAQSAHRILATLCDASLDNRQIAAVIEREPGLAARVLKVANSAYYGSSRSIGTLERALFVLGQDAVRGIAAAACLDRGVARRSAPAGIDPQALSSHCVASAFAAEMLAKTARRNAAEVFMPALLHDFGVMVQERLDTQGIIQLLAALRDAAADRVALEASLVQIDHARCARVIFEAWQLPAAITQAVRHHEDPRAVPEPHRQLAVLVHLGAQLAIEGGFAHPLEPTPAQVERGPLLALLGLDESALKPIVESLPERVVLLLQAA